LFVKKEKQDVDGRVKPGNDEGKSIPLAYPPLIPAEAGIHLCLREDLSGCPLARA
jgi:hypothetical protein